MAKYRINYACGHGSYEEQLYGKGSERERRIEWLKANKVCLDCYKAHKQAEDAAAPKHAKICLVPSAEPIISIEVSGQIEANKQALYAAGYRWSNSNDGGLFSYFSARPAKKALMLLCKVESPEHAGAWITEHGDVLEALGYSVAATLNPIDINYLAKLLQDRAGKADAKAQARAKLDEITASDPEPAISLLRKRIAELEKSSGQKWNGKIYGHQGRYNFYVANEKYDAGDAEVAEREATNKQRSTWKEKYKSEIEAAK